MHPILVIVPVAALVLGPRLWVEHVRKRHAQEDIEDGRTGGELARELLDRHRLTRVAVEHTDLGDHYDLKRKAVRLSRENYESRSLAAVVTAAHEVGHALQDATHYPPFRWRASLSQVARVTGELGTVLLIAAPATALVTRNPMPAAVIGATAFAILGTGVAAQLAALPTEYDASFRRALPLLEGEYLRGDQMEGAREMLLACSLTYLASSLAAILQFWPWLPRRPMIMRPALVHPMWSPSHEPPAPLPRRAAGGSRRTRARRPRPHRPSAVRALVRLLGKPVIRSWCQARAALAGPGAARRARPATA